MADAKRVNVLQWLTSSVGALIGYVSGDGTEIQLIKSGTFAARPAASVYNIGMTYFATDTNGVTGYTNFNGISWTKTHVGVAFETDAIRYLRDTLAVITATTGTSVGQEAYISDYGIGPGIKKYWDGDSWEFPPVMQLIGRQHTDVSCDADTAEKTLFTMSVPPLGINDQILVRAGWTFTNSANNKTERVKIGGTSFYTQAFTSNGADVRDYFARNRGATNSQVTGFNSANLYGNASGTLGTTAIQTNVATTLVVTGQKANSGETLTSNWVDVWLCGG